MQHEPDRRTTEKKTWKAHEDEEKRPVFGNDEQTYETKASVKNGILRLIFVAVAIIVELVWLVYVVNSLEEKYDLVNIGIRVLATVLALAIFSRFQTSNMKIPWLMLIMGFPVIGSVLYLLFGLTGSTGKMRRRYEEIDNKLLPELLQDQATFEEIERRDSSVANMTRYIYDYAKYPVYQNTDVTFYPDAAEGLEAQKEALRGAKNFIFMEYHAIEDRESFAAIRSILREKVREGVEVRVFYDDLGSIGFINGDFIKRLEADGIHCRVFNPMLPIVNIFFNNRDHRKITVVDGIIGFTGGYNIANEYFNITHPFGHWKDTGIRLEGDAVRSMTVMFLEMWNAVKDSDIDDTSFDRFLHPIEYTAKEHCYVQPYADNPIDDEQVGENVYMNIINNAQDYVYFMTPYLIITDEMNHALGLAAKRGVDVRIITPGIPDKMIVYGCTRSYYANLVRHGVRIFEYAPGFLHAKQCVSDGKVATCGTINLDYRSLYHHFEDGCLLYDCDAVWDIKRDFDHTFRQCREMTEKYRTGRPVRTRIWNVVLRLIAPLL
ncbi:MAG: cardiolipin synthase [Firmicutes bacterium]|nr:cardiolipin synthase [Bacillota bacterium]MBQ3963895.1 cardiolipin synthase [Bacillota bacterium]